MGRVAVQTAASHCKAFLLARWNQPEKREVEDAFGETGVLLYDLYTIRFSSPSFPFLFHLVAGTTREKYRVPRDTREIHRRFVRSTTIWYRWKRKRWNCDERDERRISFHEQLEDGEFLSYVCCLIVSTKWKFGTFLYVFL